MSEQDHATVTPFTGVRLTPIKEPRAAAPMIMFGIVGGLISTIMIAIGIGQNANAYYDSPGTPLIGFGAIIGLAAAVWMVIGIYRVVSAIDTLIADRHELTKPSAGKQAQ